MHDTLQKFFDEHTQPTHCSKRDLHDMVRPVLQLAATAQMQVITYRQMLNDARYDDHDGVLTAKMERLTQRLNALEAVIPDFRRATERVADLFREWDEIMDEDREILTAHAARKAAALGTVEKTPGAAAAADV